MKGIICYYSGSGNTRLACEYIAAKLNSVDLELFSIAKNAKPNLGNYDIVGFATFADYFGISRLMLDFFNDLARHEKPAFVFNTYGGFSGKTLKILEKLAIQKGFNVINGYSLHTPESYPPLIKMGISAKKYPKKRDLKNFGEFINKLDNQIRDINSGKETIKHKIKIGFINSLMIVPRRTKAKELMGEKYVDESLCNQCGTCERVCPYSAIVLDPKPEFDVIKCYGCWACYNHCPKKAIYTKKIKGKGHYPRPNQQLREKLEIHEG